MATPVRMPALGQTSDQLRLISWLKAEGDNVTEGEPLFEAESDKAVHEVEASSDGTLLCLIGQIDELITVGTVIAWLGEPGEQIPGDSPVPDAVAEPPDARATPAPVAPPSALRSSDVDARVPASPVARRMAREYGVDLGTVVGSGRGGRIESKDVLDARPDVALQHVGDESPTCGAGVVVERGPDDAVAPHRQAIATRLVRTTSIPHFSVSRTIDARRALSRSAEVDGATLTHVVLQAMARALEEYPRVNRVWVDDGPRYRHYADANVGLAIASDDRLVVATIRRPHHVGLAELSVSVRETVRHGREGRLAGPAGDPPPITLSNLGMYGVDQFEAIVDPDQTAILAVGRLVERPAAVGAGMIVVPQLTLTLTVDHRTVDGAEAGSFLSRVCDQLEGS